MVLNFKGCAINDLNIQRSNSQMFVYAVKGQRWFHTEHFKVTPFHIEKMLHFNLAVNTGNTKPTKRNQIITIPMTFLVDTVDNIITSLNETVIK